MKPANEGVTMTETNQETESQSSTIGRIMINGGFMRNLNKQLIAVGVAAGMMALPSVCHAAEPAADRLVPVEIGKRRELFLDDVMVDRLKGAAGRVFHLPVPREIVLVFDKPWEGNICHYHTVFRDGDLYRFYYLPGSYTIPPEGGRRKMGFAGWAYAESRDGIHWTRPNLGLVEFAGSKENNLLPKTGNITAVFRDDNPATPPEARYKALGDRTGPKELDKKTEMSLFGMQSPDGIHWTTLPGEIMRHEGTWFDSQNVAFWDPNINRYRVYYRSWSKAGSTKRRSIETAILTGFSQGPSEGTPLNYRREPHGELYTNVIRPYHRAPHLYIGMPSMYDDRGWTPALEQLPDLTNRRLQSSVPQGGGTAGRLGTALTDTMLMWSRDGVNFELAPSTFLTPGPERPGSWMYANHRAAWHLVETAPTLEGADPELSIYCTEGARVGPMMRVRRYTLRLDGFASIHASLEGGELTTPPVVFQGSRLSMNFSTSAFGSLRVELQDAGGKPIPGFALADSVELYGDTVARAAKWKNDPDLATLAGKPVRLRFVLRDADLYSLKFE